MTLECNREHCAYQNVDGSWERTAQRWIEVISRDKERLSL
jgi:hypothetical protein